MPSGNSRLFDPVWVRRALLGVLLALAAASGAFAFEAGVWRERKADTGTVFYDCLTDACGGLDALVSYRTRSDLEKLDSISFLTSQQAFERQLLGDKRYNMREVTPLETKDETLEDHILHLRVRKQVLNDGKETVYITAYLKKGANGMSIVASAPTREMAEGNFRKFLPIALTKAREIR